MTCEYDIVEKDAFLLVAVSGEMTTCDEAFSLAESVALQARIGKRGCVLFDVRGLKQDLVFHDFYRLAERMAMIVPSMSVRIASVRSPENKQLGQHLETLFQNRAINFRVFDDYNEAESWLTSANCALDPREDRTRRKGLSYFFQEEEGYLQVRTSGTPVDYDETIAYVRRVFKEVRRLGVKRLLVDESMAYINLDHHKAQVMADIPEEEKRERLEIRTAVVCAPHSIDLYKLLESHANASRNFNSKVFDQRKKAVEWLFKVDEPVSDDD